MIELIYRVVFFFGLWPDLERNAFFLVSLQYYLDDNA